MSESTQAWVTAGVRSAIGTHTQAQDAGRTDEIVALYTPDGVLELPGTDPLQGHDALREAFKGWAPEKPQLHLAANTVVTSSGEEEATAVSDLMTRPFTRPRMEAPRPKIQEFTDELVDRMLAGPKPVNLVTVLSLPLPSLMICALLGVPYADHGFFQEHAQWATRSDKTVEQQQTANAALGGYLANLLQQKMEEPAEDVLSDFAARIKDGDLALPEAVILTTSSGMFGLDNNLSYAAAKAGTVGLARSARLAGEPHDIKVNLIAPAAMTRMGGGEQPDDAQPVPGQPHMPSAAVAPMVAYLAHESCPVSGEICTAGAGRFARLFIASTEGYVHPDGPASVEDVAADWDAVNDEKGYYVPSDRMAWSGSFLKHQFG